jgi:CubicO group peptidase (beta-lactamase class C family)
VVLLQPASADAVVSAARADHVAFRLDAAALAQYRQRGIDAEAASEQNIMNYQCRPCSPSTAAAAGLYDANCAARPARRCADPRRRGLTFSCSRHSAWAALLWLCGSIANAASGSALDTGAVDRVVAEWLQSTGAPSASIAIVQDDRLVYAHAYGAARIKPHVAATVASRYAIDSVSKEFTAAAVLLLAQQNKLSLDDKLARWFPGLQAAAGVTLRQLLTHTSGIRDFWPQDFVTPEMTQPTTTAAIVTEWAQRPLDFEPGTDWQYSNTGFVLAGAIVETVSGEPLFEFLTQQVFAPLRMTHVMEYWPNLPHGVPAADDAIPYTRYGLGPVVEAPREAAGWLFAAAGLAMQPRDLALWDLSLIDRSLLNATSYDAEFAPVVLKSGKAQDYALGLDVETVDGRVRIGHAGGGSGFLAENRVWPKERAAVVVFTNNDWASPGELRDRLAFLTLPATPPEARARALFRALQSGAIDRALFSDIGNFYLTTRVLDDMRTSLAPLGPPSLIELERESVRGGMTTRHWKILCRNARLEAIERSRPDGKIEQFMIGKKED